MAQKGLMALTLVMMLSTATVFTGCKEEGDDGTTSTTSTTGNTPTAEGITFTGTGTLKVNISHVFGNEVFDLSPKAFVTAANDTIRVSQFSYYVSNFVLTSANGTKVPLDGYFLQSVLPGEPNTISLSNVPAGNYTSISYLIGVDSLANSTGSHTGDLDPSFGMYWTWNTGYVFFRLKGRFGEANNSIAIDIGGDANVMELTNDLSAFKVKGTSVTTEMLFDVATIFNSPNVYDLKVDDAQIHTAAAPGIIKLVPNIESAITVKSIQ